MLPRFSFFFFSRVERHLLNWILAHWVGGMGSGVEWSGEFPLDLTFCTCYFRRGLFLSSSRLAVWVILGRQVGAWEDGIYRTVLFLGY